MVALPKPDMTAEALRLQVLIDDFSLEAYDWLCLVARTREERTNTWVHLCAEAGKTKYGRDRLDYWRLVVAELRAGALVRVPILAAIIDRSVDAGELPLAIECPECGETAAYDRTGYRCYTCLNPHCGHATAWEYVAQSMTATEFKADAEGNTAPARAAIADELVARMGVPYWRGARHPIYVGEL